MQYYFSKSQTIKWFQTQILRFYFLSENLDFFIPYSINLFLVIFNIPPFDINIDKNHTK